MPIVRICAIIIDFFSNTLVQMFYGDKCNVLNAPVKAEIVAHFNFL